MAEVIDVAVPVLVASSMQGSCLIKTCPVDSDFLCAQEYGRQHRWMAFIDANEYFIINNGLPDLPTLLRIYVKYGGLGVSTVVFGSSGYVKRPTAGALGSYYRRGSAVICTQRCRPRHLSL